MSSIVPLAFEGAEVRIIDQAGNPWFVLADVCRVLEISNPRDAASRLDEDEKDGVGITDAIGREQNNTVVNESGLYSLILTSRKDAAKRFKKWVTSEVLPTIRKTGAYGAPAAPDLNDPDTLRHLLLNYSAEVKTLRNSVVEKVEIIAAQAPKVLALDRIATADGSLCITAAAKNLQIRPKDLFSWLQSRKWIYRRGKEVLGYQLAIQQGLIEHKLTTVDHPDGTPCVYTQARLTPKGLVKIAQEWPTPLNLAPVP